MVESPILVVGKDFIGPRPTKAQANGRGDDRVKLRKSLFGVLGVRAAQGAPDRKLHRLHTPQGRKPDSFRCVNRESFVEQGLGRVLFFRIAETVVRTTMLAGHFPRVDVWR